MYLFQTSIAPTASLYQALVTLRGIGCHQARQIGAMLGYPLTQPFASLSSGEVTQLEELLRAQFYLQEELRQRERAHIHRLVRLQCYRGHRHRAGLPVRGQPTHGNGRTARSRPKPSF
jgi:small subunit ribosomal protein S13